MTTSQNLFMRAQRVIPGGVNSPVRAFKGVGGEPVFFKSGHGAWLYDVDNQKYLDYVGSWGPLILGHCHEKIIAAITQVLHSGTSFGAPTELEIDLAEKIIKLMPAIEKIRMVNSGTEATMTAIRLARGFTGKTKVIKFNGCYHGHSDGLLVKAGSGLLTLGIPSSAGVLTEVAEHTLTADFNDIQQVMRLFEMYPHDVAAVIIEPIAGNMGFIRPHDDFLQKLRLLCDDYGTVLIFDEVMTGFRVALGGAQAVYQVSPDLTTLGKVIGGGLPVGALGGRSEIMDCLAPIGDVYQAGTLSGNPLAMAAGLATLQEIEQPGFYERLDHLTRDLMNALSNVTQALKIPFYADSLGGMFGFFFTEKALIRNYADVAACNAVLFRQFFHGMLAESVYFAPSMYEAGFMSSAHQVQDIYFTQMAAERVLQHLVLGPN